MGIALGRPISASLPICKNFSTDKCYNLETMQAENVSDEFSPVMITLQHGVVSGITVIITVADADLAYKDLVERFGKPTSGIFDSDLSWHGKHLQIVMSRPIDLDHPGSIWVEDLDVKLDNPLPEHKNSF